MDEVDGARDRFHGALHRNFRQNFLQLLLPRRQLKSERSQELLA